MTGHEFAVGMGKLLREAERADLAPYDVVQATFFALRQYGIHAPVGEWRWEAANLRRETLRGLSPTELAALDAAADAEGGPTLP